MAKQRQGQGPQKNPNPTNRRKTLTQQTKETENRSYLGMEIGMEMGGGRTGSSFEIRREGGRWKKHTKGKRRRRRKGLQLSLLLGSYEASIAACFCSALCSALCSACSFIYECSFHGFDKNNSNQAM
jgi:hypothetical protein